MLPHGIPVPLPDGRWHLVVARGVERIRVTRWLVDGPALSPGLSLGTTPEAIAWRLCGLAPVDLHDRQRLPEVPDARRRLTRRHRAPHLALDPGQSSAFSACCAAASRAALAWSSSDRRRRSASRRTRSSW